MAETTIELKLVVKVEADTIMVDKEELVSIISQKHHFTYADIEASLD